ncbi:hypothetical protein niasHT_018925 [Heterodera trifolii]|uniref:Effector protein n=1 Tax=Heterodera trifolii TaxID=157864 RepID=A0ABD2LDL3_9BILA
MFAFSPFSSLSWPFSPTILLLFSLLALQNSLSVDALFGWGDNSKSESAEQSDTSLSINLALNHQHSSASQSDEDETQENAEQPVVQQQQQYGSGYGSGGYGSYSSGGYGSGSWSNSAGTGTASDSSSAQQQQSGSQPSEKSGSDSEETIPYGDDMITGSDAGADQSVDGQQTMISSGSEIIYSSNMNTSDVTNYASGSYDESSSNYDSGSNGTDGNNAIPLLISPNSGSISSSKSNYNYSSVSSSVQIDYSSSQNGGGGTNYLEEQHNSDYSSSSNSNQNGDNAADQQNQQQQSQEYANYLNSIRTALNQTKAQTQQRQARARLAACVHAISVLLWQGYDQLLQNNGTSCRNNGGTGNSGGEQAKDGSSSCTKPELDDVALQLSQNQFGQQLNQTVDGNGANGISGGCVSADQVPTTAQIIAMINQYSYTYNLINGQSSGVTVSDSSPNAEITSAIGTIMRQTSQLQQQLQSNSKK